MFSTHADDAAVHIRGEGNPSPYQEISPVAVQLELPDTPEKKLGNFSSEIYVLDMLDIARFWSKIEVRDRQLCWPWRYGSNEGGYGEFRLLGGNKERELAHRFAYQIAYGPIAPDVIIRHGCDNPLCCNWEHLIVGTHADNVQDRVDRDRSARGETSGRAKLCEEDVKHIRESHFGVSYLAHKYRVHESTIRDIKRRKTWTHI